MTIEKNGIYRGVVASLGSEGEGVVNLIIEGARFTAFVPGCIPGEEVDFAALKVKGGVVYGKLINLVSPSPSRTEPVCPVYGRCGGCQLQHMEYSRQLEFKRDLVKNCLKKLGGIEADVNETEHGEMQYGYRNKLALPVGINERGENVVGVYAPRSHRIVPVTRSSPCSKAAISDSSPERWAKTLL